jgi:predicted short-subunit dehydrogenase-like oxidoreductase (DUF2520 family)
MKKPLRVGLVVEGNATRSVMVRLPKLPEVLGPVKATVPRVARRLSNFLRAGEVAHEYRELETATLLLLRVPDERLAAVVDELAASELTFRNVSVALCESWLTAEALAPLAERGASVASVQVLQGRRNWFLAEGQLGAIRAVRGLLDYNDCKLIEIREGSKAKCFAAGVLAGALPMPLYLSAQHALRDAGLSGNNLAAVLDEIAMTLFREFAKGARAAWGGPLSEASELAKEQHMSWLEGNDPQLAATLSAYLTLAHTTFDAHKSTRRLVSFAPAGSGTVKA